jgi:hypothetical protein
MPIQVEARDAEGGTVTYWIRALLQNALILVGWGDPADEGSPRVVVSKSADDEVLLQRTGTLRQAQRAAGRYTV